jgi:hypothetical protein
MILFWLVEKREKHSMLLPGAYALQAQPQLHPAPGQPSPHEQMIAWLVSHPHLLITVFMILFFNDE